MLHSRVDILFGGGWKFWLPTDFAGGVRDDEKNLIISAQDAGYQIVWNRQEMLDLTSGPALGLFENGAMTTYAPEPSLAEMAQKAIAILNAESIDEAAPQPKFFLMIEGSQIDWAGHVNDTNNSIRQTLLFDMAVKKAFDFAVRNRRTLLIVTADHETGGLVFEGRRSIRRRPVPVWTTTNHTGVNVPLFAFGPGSQEFTGVMDNTDIAKKIAWLMTLSPFPQGIEQTATVKLESIN